MKFGGRNAPSMSQPTGTSELHTPSPRPGVWGTLANPGRLPLALFLILLTFAAYANSFACDLVLDNRVIVADDPRLKAATWSNVQNIFTHSYWWPKWETDLYRPLTTLSYWFNYSVLGNGLAPAGYHVINLGLHAVNVLLVLSLLRRIGARPWPAAFAAAVFAVHPLGVECVTNVVGRADLLALLAILGCLHLHIDNATAQSWRRALGLVGLSLLALAGIFCKESAVAVLGVMALYDGVVAPRQDGDSYWAAIWRRFRTSGWMTYLAVLPSLLAFATARTILLRNSPIFGQIFIDNPIAGADFLTGELTAIKVVGYYLVLLVWPARLSCDYSYNQIHRFGWTWSDPQDLHAWVALAALLGLLALSALAWRRNRPVFFFMAFFAIMFLPTSNLLITIGTIMAERLLYLPLVGFVGALAMLLSRRPEDWPRLNTVASRGVIALAAVGIIAGLATRTFLRNEDWRDELTLWSSAARTCPDSYKVYKGMSTAIRFVDSRGDRIDEAIAWAERGLAVIDAHPLPLVDVPGPFLAMLADHYLLKGKLLAEQANLTSLRPSAEAIVWYRKSRALLERAIAADHAVNQASRQAQLKRGRPAEEIPDVGAIPIYNSLGYTEMALDHPDEALAAFAYLRRLDPVNPQSYLGAVQACLFANRFEEAAINLIELLILDTENAVAWKLLPPIYANLLPESQAIVFPQGRPTLNDTLPMVRRDLNEAARRLVEAFLQAKRPADARILRELAIHRFSCPPQTFAALSPQP